MKSSSQRSTATQRGHHKEAKSVKSKTRSPAPDRVYITCASATIIVVSGGPHRGVTRGRKRERKRKESERGRGREREREREKRERRRDRERARETEREIKKEQPIHKTTKTSTSRFSDDRIEMEKSRKRTSSES